MPRPQRPWFRFYVEAVHDRKLRRLKPEHRWLFVACLAAARQSPDPGVLLVGNDDPMGYEDLADFAGMTVPAVERGMDALLRAGLVEVDKVRDQHWDERDCEWSIPRWSERQYESDDVTKRTAKHRSREQVRNVPTTFPGTAPETETETETSSQVDTRDPADEVWKIFARLKREQASAQPADVERYDRKTVANACGDTELVSKLNRWLREFHATPSQLAAGLIEGRAHPYWTRRTA